MRRVCPESPLAELPFRHEIFRHPFAFPSGAPKIHEHDGGPPRVYGVFHGGRMVVLYTFDTRPISIEILSSLRLQNLGMAAAYGVLLMTASAAAFLLWGQGEAA